MSSLKLLKMINNLIKFNNIMKTNKVNCDYCVRNGQNIQRPR